MSLSELIVEARQSGEWNRFIDAVPYMRFLGVSVEERDGRLIGKMQYADHLIGNASIPALHGGSLGGLLESAAQFELLYRAESVVLPKTITFTIDYLRPGRPVDVWVSAKIVRRGRRVSSVDAWAWQDDEKAPIATAKLHALVMANR